MRRNRKNRPARERGSALLVSLMVIAGLSLLGLALVAVSETESSIAVSERNFVQAQAAAEAGANAIVEMFQDADWAAARGILPPNSTSIKTLRKYTDGTQDYYKPSASMRLFSVPFKGSTAYRFYGQENTADVWIDESKGTTAKNYLTTFSNKILLDPTLRISAVRVYAPPMPNAKINAFGFYETGAARYGVATVRVTAQKFVSDTVLAERTVKLVIAETPFPTVDGAIETSGSLVGQGNFKVYWGKVLSEKELQLARPAAGMPWWNATDVLWFEQGYDSTFERTINTDYVADKSIVHAPAAAIIARPELAKFAYLATTSGTTPATVPDPTFWPAIEGDSTATPDGGVTWKAIPAKPYPIVGTTFGQQAPWLYQLLDEEIEDPWLHARARSTLVYGNGKGDVPCGNAAKPHPCDYDNAAWPLSRYSNFFQFQNTDNAANEQEQVFFPTMDYEFWKAVAKSSSNSVKSGVYYFKYAGNGTNNLFQGPGGLVKDITYWLNSAPDVNGKPKNGLRAGFYFFDTKNGKNPQFGKGGTLTPDVDINASVGKPFQMQGYIYLNAKSFGTTGQGNLVDDDVFYMPGEPYRDVGYREIDPVAKKWVLEGASTLPAGEFKIVGRNNGIYDWQDLDQDGVVDVFIAATTVTRPNGEVINTFAPVPWFPTCKPGSNGEVGVTCSEPHEPFLNMTYPDKNNPKDPVKIGWYDPATGAGSITNFRKPKVRTGTNSVNVCTINSSPADCTSNSYDVDGALVSFAPLLVGALYNEGGYSGSGNATYYGSLLMRGSFDTTGTPDVFFNECLARGCLESQLKMQRVMVTSIETDQ